MNKKGILILLAVLIVLMGVYFVYGRPKPVPEEPVVYVWNVNDSDLTHVVISLPREGKSLSFIKIVQGDKFPWFFDDEQKSPVDSVRWGGGIPLLLSGPSASRVLLHEATDEELTEFGLMPTPLMQVILTMTDNSTMTIDVGDNTPNGGNYYVRAPSTTGVATVDASWYDVISGLVDNPPYAATANATASAAE